MAANHRFEFRAFLHDLQGGLDTVHASVDDLRRSLGREKDDKALMYFETALAEIANNALVHGPAKGHRAVQLVVRTDAQTVVAWVIDSGASVSTSWVREMPPASSEAGRGLALARSMLDTLEYERKGQLNQWRLVKKL